MGARGEPPERAVEAAGRQLLSPEVKLVRDRAPASPSSPTRARERPTEGDRGAGSPLGEPSRSSTPRLDPLPAPKARRG